MVIVFQLSLYDIAGTLPSPSTSATSTPYLRYFYSLVFEFVSDLFWSDCFDWFWGFLLYDTRLMTTKKLRSLSFWFDSSLTSSRPWHDPPRSMAKRLPRRLVPVFLDFLVVIFKLMPSRSWNVNSHNNKYMETELGTVDNNVQCGIEGFSFFVWLGWWICKGVEWCVRE